MRKSLMAYGIITGLVVIIVNTVNLEFGQGQVWLGLLVMLIAFSAIFVAVKQYRDHTLGGVISFWSALSLGLGITAVASIVYVLSWEAYLAITDYKFIDEYAQHIAEAAEAEKFVKQYSKVLFRLPITFAEVVPTGLLVSFVSAAALRNHRSAG